MTRFVEHWLLRGEPARRRRSFAHRVLHPMPGETMPPDFIVMALENERLDQADQQRRRYARQRRIEAAS